MPEIFDQLFQQKTMGKVCKLKEFFKSYLALIQYKYVVVELTTLIEEPQEYVQQSKRVNHIGKIFKTGRELIMTSHIGDYDMDYIILELGSIVKIIMRQNFESMGKLRLVWSPIQLILEIFLKVLPIG